MTSQELRQIAGQLEASSKTALDWRVQDALLDAVTCILVAAHLMIKIEKADEEFAKKCFKEARRLKRKAKREKVKNLDHLHD